MISDIIKFNPNTLTFFDETNSYTITNDEILKVNSVGVEIISYIEEKSPLNFIELFNHLKTIYDIDDELLRIDLTNYLEKLSENRIII